MANVVSCAKCKAQYDATGYRVGVQFACTRCNSLVTVPDLGAPAAGGEQEFVPTIVDERGDGAVAKELEKVKKKGKGKPSADDDEDDSPKGKKKGKKKDKGRSARKGGRGDDDEDDDRRGRGAGKKKDNTPLVIGMVVGGLVLVGLLFFMMSGKPKEAPKEEAAKSNKNDAPPADPLADIKTPAQVKAAAEKFWASLREGNAADFDRLFDSKNWLDIQLKNSGKAVAKLGQDEFMNRYWRPDGKWKEHANKIELTPNQPKTAKGEELYIWPNGLTLVVYTAKWKAFPEKKPWDIKLKLEPNVSMHCWRITEYDDAKYQPWMDPTMYSVFFDNKYYKVSEEEYKAHEQEYKDCKRMPPAPFDTPVREEKPPENQPPDNSGPSNPGGEVTPQMPPDVEPSGWGADVVKFLKNRDYDKAQSKCSGQKPDKDLCAKLIHMIMDGDAESVRGDDPEAMIAQEASKCLQAMFGGSTKSDDYQFFAGPRHDPDHNSLVVTKWIREWNKQFPPK